jgi:phosphate transport system protein
MIGLSTKMTRGALEAFFQLDAAAAKRVMAIQAEIEREANEMVRWIGEQVQKSPNLIPAALHCFSASRHVERIGSHAANIAEDVIYLVEGEIVRHQHPPSSSN